MVEISTAASIASVAALCYFGINESEGLSPNLAPTMPAAPLERPVLSFDAANFSTSREEFPIIVHNPNPAGSSEIAISIDAGSWQTYTPGTTIKLRPGSNVATYAASSDTDAWINSPPDVRVYDPVQTAIKSPAISYIRPNIDQFLVSLTNPNDPAETVLEYSLDEGSSWVKYTGPFSLGAKDFPEGVFVIAQVKPAEGFDSYILSSVNATFIDSDNHLSSSPWLGKSGT